jgi:GT2 family glycosyltransferase
MSGRDADELLTIVICTHNRADDLRVTLEAIQLMKWAEVIVVDNSSSDATRDLLFNFPWTTVIHNNENVGVPGFSIGVAAASTPYVLLLDDDAIPDPSVPDLIVARFEREPKAAAIACHVVSTSGVVVTRDWPDHPVLFWGCGAGVRVAAARRTEPMFYPKLRLHGTELDWCIRLYSAGYCVVYEAGACVTHRFSEVNRSPRRGRRSVTYGSIRFAWDHFSVGGALRATWRALFSRRVNSVEALIGWLQGLGDVLKDLGDIRQRRSVVPRHVEDAYLASVWEYQPRGTPRHPRGFPL